MTSWNPYLLQFGSQTVIFFSCNFFHYFLYYSFLVFWNMKKNRIFPEFYVSIISIWPNCTAGRKNRPKTFNGHNLKTKNFGSYFNTFFFLVPESLIEILSFPKWNTQCNTEIAGFAVYLANSVVTAVVTFYDIFR